MSAHKKMVNKRGIGLVRFKSVTVAALVIAQVVSPSVLAAPTGGSVMAGNGSISVSGNVTAIDQLSQRLALDWQSFDVASNEIVRFNQPGKNAIALNRILSNNPSRIMGLIEANGRIILASPAGILFTESSSVNVNALIASGLDINADDFMKGNLLFKSLGSADAYVINRGLINASTSVSLLGGTVSNEGAMALIQAELVTLNAASEALLTFDASGMIGVKVNKEVLENTRGLASAVSNSGEIIAGSVLIEADVAANLFDRAVNNEGLISAAGIDVSGGEIRLSGRGGDTFNSGSLDASSQQGNGGRIVIEGDRIALTNNALINASGGIGGGEVLIGGGLRGENPSVSHAEALYMGAGAQISANATRNGDGGTVVLWSDNSTRFEGHIEARAGLAGGNGGLVETSGKQWLSATGSVNTLAPAGETGLWLLDPADVVIDDFSASNTAITLNGDTFEPDSNAAASQLDASILVGQLATTSITVTTTNSGADGTGDGDITIAEPLVISNTVDTTLTLNAFRNIIVNDTITATGATGAVSNPGDPGINGMGLTLTAGNNIAINAAISSTGGAGGDANSGNNDGGSGGNGGSFNFTAGNNITIAAALTSTGGVGGTAQGTGSDGVSGDGGSIQLTANSSSINLTAAVSSVGGAGSAAGNAGSFISSAINFVNTSGSVSGSSITVNTGQGNVASSNDLGSLTASGAVSVNGGTDDDQYTLSAAISGSSVVINADGGSGNVGSDSLLLGLGDNAVVSSSSRTAIVAGVTATEIDIINTGGGNDTFTGDTGDDDFVLLGANSVSINNISISALENVIGGGTGTDTVTATSGGSSFALTSASAATVDSIAFSQIETFAGGIGDDSFSMIGTINTTINAGGGSDTFTGSASDDSFVLQSANSVMVNGLTLTNLDVAIGGAEASADTVIAANSGSSFALTSASAATVDSIAFSQIEAFTGGIGADNFSMTGTINTTINAGGGSDTFTGSAGDQTYAIQSSGSIQVDGLILTALELVVAGESGSDTDTVQGTATGDSYVLQGNESVLVQGITFSQVESVTAGIGSDLVTAASGGSSFALTSISAATVDSIDFSGIETFAGAVGDDSFSMTGTINITIDAGGVGDSDTFTGSASDDSFVLQGANSVTVNGLTLANLEVVSGGVGAETIGDTVTAASGGSSFALTSASAATVDSIAFSQIETFAGGAGDDSFSMTGTINTTIDAGGDVTGDTFTGSTADDSFVLQSANSVTVNGLTLANLEVASGGAETSADTVTAASSGSSFALTSASAATVDSIAFSQIETFAGGVGDDSFSMTGTINTTIDAGGVSDSDTFTGSASDDSFILQGANSVTVNGLTLTSLEVASGGAETSADTVTAANSGSNFALTSASAATVDSIAFSQIEAFAGGIGADNFSMTGTINTTINAGGGSDTFTGSAGDQTYAIQSSGSIQVDGLILTALELVVAGESGSDTDTVQGTATGDSYVLQGNESVFVQGIAFSQVELVAAGTGSDSVTAAAGGSSFALTSVSAAIVDGIAFSAVDSFAGAGGNDNFSMTGSIALTIDTGGGSDTFTGSAIDDDFVLQGANSVRVNSLLFNNLESASGSGGTNTVTAAVAGSSFSLTSASAATVDSIAFSQIGAFAGGAGADNFSMTGAFAGSVDAGGGSDTFTGSASDDSFVLQGANNVTVNGLTLTNLEVASGGTGTDTVIAASGGSSFALTSTSAATVDSIVFSQIDTFAGGAGADNFSMTGAFAGSVDAGDGSDTFTGSASDDSFILQGANSVTVNGLTLTSLEVASGGAETSADTVTAANSGSSFALTSASAATVDSIDFSGVETFAGGIGADNFSMTGTINTTINASGGSDTFTGSAGDQTYAIQSSGSIQVDGLILTALELVVAGESGGDADTVQATNLGDSYVLQGNESVLVQGITFSQVESVTAGTGTDTLIGQAITENYALQGVGSVAVQGVTFTNLEAVNAGNGGTDTINGQLINETYQLQAANGVQVAGLAFTDIEVINAGAGDDSFALSATSSISLDGGEGSETSGDSIIGGAVGGSNYNVTGVDSGTIDGSAFNNIENLSGTAANDSFTLTSGSIGDLAGAGGDDVFTLAGAAFNSLDGGEGGETTGDSLIGGSVYIVNAVDGGSVNGNVFTNIENLTGSAGSDSFSLQAGSINTLFGGAGDDSFSLEGATFAAIDGGEGGESIGDSIIGGRNYIVNAADGGTVDLVVFANIENLTGTNLIDSFNFEGAGSLTGAVDGLAAIDTVSFAAANSAVVYINGVGFINIEEVTGSANVDTLSGFNQYSISDTDSGTAASGGLAFSSFENLVGTSGNDNFSFVNDGNISGVIDGAAGTNDEIDYSQLSGLTLDINTAFNNINQVRGGGSGFTLVGGNSYIVDGANSGTVDGLRFINWANLTGTAGVDSFVFGAAGSLAGTISGGAGIDSADYSALAVKSLDISSVDINSIEALLGGGDGFSLSGGRDYVVNGDNAGTVDGITFSGWSSLAGTSGNDSFLLVAGNLTGGIDGVSGDDMVTGGNGRSYDFIFTANNSATINGMLASNIANYSGADQGDSFSFNGDVTVSGVIDGGLGADVFTIDSIVNTTINGSAGDDTFTLGDNAVVASLNGGAGIDTVSFTGSQSNWSFEAGVVKLNNILLQVMELFNDSASQSTTLVTDGVLSFNPGQQISVAGGMLSIQDTGALQVSAESIVVNRLIRDGDVSLNAIAGINGGDIESQVLTISSGAELLLGQVNAAAVDISAAGVLNVAVLNADTVVIQQAAEVSLGQVNTGNTVINSSGSVLVQALMVADLDIAANGDVDIVTTSSGRVDITTGAGDINIIEGGDLLTGVIRASGDDAAINIRAQGNIVLGTVVTQGRNSGSVSIISDSGDILAGRPLAQARTGDTDVVAGQINIESAFGRVGVFERPIIVQSTSAPTVLNLQPFINGFGATPTALVSGGVLGSSALDVASSSGLSSAVQTLLDSLAEIDPGVFKNDELVEREANSIAMPEDQQLQ